tara:strand:+ start:629 stop:1186 length:558 start_codon:yes stop_codon:yes gene_type:complete
MREIVRHKTNPFVEGMVVKKRSKSIQLSRLGKDSNVLINQDTGEHFGTHVTTHRKVDDEQFVKLFTANIGFTFDLKSAGIKAFSVLMWTVQHRAISKDQVDMERLCLDDFLEWHKDSDRPLKLSLATFTRGISELEAAHILAKTLKKGRYFINPNFAFNGDRIAFTKVIERAPKGDAHLQQDLIE